MTRRKLIGSQADIVEQFPIHADLEIEWYMVDDVPELDKVWLLLVNCTNIGGKVINTIDRVNISYYIDEHTKGDIIEHIWENLIYEI
tara:strand:- start:4953 stop:5213 length:261 start_codon:yes stop_codon:yes gene_type:complete